VKKRYWLRQNLAESQCTVPRKVAAGRLYVEQARSYQSPFSSCVDRMRFLAAWFDSARVPELIDLFSAKASSLGWLKICFFPQGAREPMMLLGKKIVVWLQLAGVASKQIFAFGWVAWMIDDRDPHFRRRFFFSFENSKRPELIEFFVGEIQNQPFWMGQYR
jgi:hypothetical protein